MRELKLKYVIDLVSNVGGKAKADAKALQEAQAMMAAAITGTNNKWLDYTKLAALAGKNTAMMKDVLTGTTDKFAALDRAITQVGRNSSTERQIGYLQRLSTEMDRAVNRAGQLRQALANGLDKAPGAFAAGAGAYYGARSVVAPPLQAFATLEQATMDLRVAMTDAKGKVAPAFDKISAEAVKLGNELPGTTKDFMRSALALKANGTPDQVIANGGLRASAYMGVLLGLDQEQAAVTVAKTREAYGLKEDELVPAADAMQKARFAFGLKPSDLLAANTYASGTLNAQKWSGLGNMREVLALQGLAAQRGIDGSVFGTDLKDFMQRLTMMDHRLEKKSPEARRTRDLMKSYGIDLDVIGADGYLASPSKVVQEMQKFGRLKPQERTAAIHTIFGEQGGQMAHLLAQTDPGKFAEMLATGDNQGDLNTRLAMTTSTLKNSFEALRGTTENLLATMAGPLGELATKAVRGANDFIGGPVQDFFQAHPKTGAGTLLGAGGLGTWLTGKLGASAWRTLAARGAAGAGVAGAEAAGAAGAAGAGALGSTALVGGVGATGAFAGYEVWRLGSALKDLWDINHREGVVPSAYSRARLAALANDPAAARALGMPMGLGGPTSPDFMALTAPGGSPFATGPGVPGMGLGQGQLDVLVKVQDDRVSVSTNLAKPMSLVRINNGNTNPGGYGR